MTDVVVDASVASKWFLLEEDSRAAVRLLAADVKLHAPELLRIELANAFWKNVLKKTIGVELWETARPELERSIGHWHSSAPYLEEPLAMACANAHPIFLGEADDEIVVALSDWKA